MALITCRDLTLSYGAKTVVQNLSFSLCAGQRILVCGENGSGKSTLVRTLVDLHTPTKGEILYADGVKRGIGYLPQKAGEDLRFPASAFEIAASGLRGRSLFLSREQKARVLESLKLFGADSFCRESFSALSGGMRQRVLLARATLSATHALLLDEPVTGLDPKITHALYHNLRALSRTGLGILFVSHDISGALDFCTHVLHLPSGSAPQFYTADEYRESAHFCALCKEVHHV